MKQVFWLFPYIPTYLLASGRMLWLFWVVHLLIFCISISFSHLSYRFIKSVTELKNIKLSWPCQSAVGYYHSHDNNLKFYVVYDYILDANLSLRRPPMFHSGLWGTPSGGPCRSGDHQCSMWPVRNAFGWSVLHLRSLKGAVSTEGKHPWCTGKSAHLWEQMSPRFYVMMKALCIQCDYELSLVFLSASCWRIDVFTWRIFQSVRAERPSFSFGGSDVYTTFVTCRYAHNAFLSSSQTMSV